MTLSTEWPLYKKNLYAFISNEGTYANVGAAL